MRTEDMHDITDAAVAAGLMDNRTADRFMRAYHEFRDEKEREADERAAKVLAHSWLERVLFWRVPVIGMPAVLVAVIVWVIVEAVK